MRRTTFPFPRPDWETKIQNEGLTYSQADPTDTHYWNEFAGYVFSQPEIDAMASAGREMYSMCLKAVRHIFTSAWLDKLQLSEEGKELARRSWERQEPSFYGRFDFIYNSAENTMKLLEFNADTPTGMVESAVSQSNWFKQKNLGEQGYREWNTLGDSFVNRWEALKAETGGRVLHLACVNEETDPSGEDMENIRLQAFCAQQAGWETHLMTIDQLNWTGERWEDETGSEVTHLFKLYPWEDIIFDTHPSGRTFGDILLNDGAYDKLTWFEPAWKMALSNKVLLAVLWELFPNHPLLVPAYADHQLEEDDERVKPIGVLPEVKNWVRKPIFGREGSGITIDAPDYDIWLEPEEGDFMAETASEAEMMYQEFIPFPNYPSAEGDNHPMVGMWVVDGNPEALAIRESDGMVTNFGSRFVPTLVGTSYDRD